MMKIKILPEILSNKIAAGEVVERPASVVKELIENAIDAKSTRIWVEIEKGGRSLIQVSDNGMGMNRDDALLSIERYATSKIATDPDLFSIKTLGFRGEALPSICSVSRFSLVTRAKDTDVGVKIIIHGGKIINVEETGTSPGTMVTVHSLFYNTPARRKFLKTINTEMGHIADTLAGMALGNPHIRFKLTHNKKTVKSWTRAKDPGDRVGDVLGRSTRNHLFKINFENPMVSITGWVGHPDISRSTTRGAYLFVNNRWVRDRMIQHALFAGFSGRLMKGRHPVAVLFITVPHDQVDVNVHPTKHEVRFIHQRVVHDAVKQAVYTGLSDFAAPFWSKPGAGAKRPASPLISEPVSSFSQKKQFTGPQTIKPAAAGFSNTGFRSTPNPSKEDITQQNASDPTFSINPDAPSHEDQHHDSKAQNRGSFEIVQSSIWEKRFFKDLTVIGQYHGTYIICESENSLVLIDQHAAHERIVFEALKKQAAEKKPAAQRLLLPETIETGYSEAQILIKLIPQLDVYGLEVDHFGGNTFVVKSIPTLLDNRNIERLITELVEKTAEIGVDSKLEKAMDECLMIMACHSAIRARHRLTDREISAMLVQLDGCENPSNCPHGRPTWIQWRLSSIFALRASGSGRRWGELSQSLGWIFHAIDTRKCYGC